MNATVLLSHVSAYAEAVRSHLVGLSAEQIEDLTDGLEADLVDALEDIGPIGMTSNAPLTEGGQRHAMIDLTRRFGPAERYAAELRAAAGLEAPQPPVPASGPRAVVRRAFGRVGGLRRRTVRALVRLRDRGALLLESPRARHGVDLAGSLRPVWWVVRAWVLFGALQGLIGGGWDQGRALVPRGGAMLLCVGLVLVSVQWGRGRWRSWPGGRQVVTGLSVVAGVLAVPALVTVYELGVRYTEGWAQPQPTTVVEYVVGSPVDDPSRTGVWVAGQQVSNLFVYDAQGEPLTDVQIYDDRGRPVRTVDSAGLFRPWFVPEDPRPWFFQPAHALDGRQRWNAYPLRASRQETLTDGMGEVAFAEDAQDMPFPFAKAPALDLERRPGRGAGGTEGGTGPGIEGGGLPDVGGTSGGDLSAEAPVEALLTQASATAGTGERAGPRIP